MSSVMLFGVMWCFRSLNIRHPRPGNPAVWLIHPQLKSRLLYPQLSSPHPQPPPCNLCCLGDQLDGIPLACPSDGPATGQ